MRTFKKGEIIIVIYISHTFSKTEYYIGVIEEKVWDGNYNIGNLIPIKDAVSFGKKVGDLNPTWIEKYDNSEGREILEKYIKERGPHLCINIIRELFSEDD